MDRQELLSKRVVVICGGWSDERDISILSARECHDALVTAGFATVDVVDLASRDFIPRLLSGGYDVAFVAMHGAYGEDGCVQGLLEVLHLPYTFSGVAASAVASEKQLSKAVYEAEKIRAPRGVDLAAGTVLTDDQLDTLVETLGLPLFVKPAANGSSFGISRVTERAGVNAAIELASAGGGRVLVEECVEGVEITVPVIGNDDAHAAAAAVRMAVAAHAADERCGIKRAQFVKGHFGDAAAADFATLGVDDEDFGLGVGGAVAQPVEHGLRAAPALHALRDVDGAAHAGAAFNRAVVLRRILPVGAQRPGKARHDQDGDPEPDEELEKKAADAVELGLHKLLSAR